MDSEQKTENQREPAIEKPVEQHVTAEQPPVVESSDDRAPGDRPPGDRSTGERPQGDRPQGGGQRDNRRGRGRGRSRFKQRDNRGERNDSGDRGGDRPPDRAQQPRQNFPERSHNQSAHPSGSIGRALEQVDQIRIELAKVLEDMDEVLQTLEQAEREKTASEIEIEKLRESLRSLHRAPSYPRNPRNDSQSFRSPAPTSEPAPAENELSPPPEDD